MPVGTQNRFAAIVRIEGAMINHALEAVFLNLVTGPIDLGPGDGGEGVTGRPQKSQAAIGISIPSGISTGSTSVRYGYKRWVSISMR